MLSLILNRQHRVRYDTFDIRSGGRTYVDPEATRGGSKLVSLTITYVKIGYGKEKIKRDDDSESGSWSYRKLDKRLTILDGDNYKKEDTHVTPFFIRSLGTFVSF